MIRSVNDDEQKRKEGNHRRAPQHLDARNRVASHRRDEKREDGVDEVEVGHHLADEALRHFAVAIVRHQVVNAFRFGGDEILQRIVVRNPCFCSEHDRLGEIRAEGRLVLQLLVLVLESDLGVEIQHRMQLVAHMRDLAVQEDAKDDLESDREEKADDVLALGVLFGDLDELESARDGAFEKEGVDDGDVGRDATSVHELHPDRVGVFHVARLAPADSNEIQGAKTDNEHEGVAGHGAAEVLAVFDADLHESSETLGEGERAVVEGALGERDEGHAARNAEGRARHRADGGEEGRSAARVPRLFDER